MTKKTKTRFMRKTDVIKAEQALKKADVSMSTILNWKNTDGLSFGSCSTATTTSNSAGNKEDMESTMNIGIENNTAEARRSLSSALARFSREHYEALCTKFMLNDPDVPKTAAGIIEAIKAGNITIPEKDDDCECWTNWRGIKFAKNFKADRCGFDKAWKEFTKERSALELDITVLDPVTTLDSFRSFEKKHTIH